MEWTKLEFNGPPPANRLDFACCTLRIRLPVCEAGAAVESIKTDADDDVKSCSDQANEKLKIVSSDNVGKDQANIVDLNFMQNSEGKPGTKLLYISFEITTVGIMKLVTWMKFK